MGVVQQMRDDFKAAMKNREAAKVSCLRMVRAALASKEKDKRAPLSEDEALAILKTLAKQRVDSAEQFRNGGRVDLAVVEEAELKLIGSYLPAQMGEDQINQILDEVFAEVQPAGPKDMGKVMKAVMAKVGPAADGKLVNSLVRARL